MPVICERFGSAMPSLIGHLHTPRGAAIDLCAVICPAPFGYDNVCGHRGLRILADRLAGGGIATLRFDFPGTGDSDGEQELPLWKAAVASAVATARRETGCKRIALIGVGLGGAIALGALDGGLDVDKLMLWGVPARARAWLREQRAYQKVAELASATKIPNAPKPPPDPAGIEVLVGLSHARGARRRALGVRPRRRRPPARGRASAPAQRRWWSRASSAATTRRWRPR